MWISKCFANATLNEINKQQLLSMLIMIGISLPQIDRLNPAQMKLPQLDNNKWLTG